MHLVDAAHGILVSPSASLPVLPVEALLPVRVHLELGDDDLARVDPDLDRGPVGLLPGDALDVDDEFAAGAGDNLALTVPETSADDGDLVVDTDGHGADAALGLELLGKVGDHELPAGLGVSSEVGLAALSAGRRHGGRVLHLI